MWIQCNTIEAALLQRGSAAPVWVCKGSTGNQKSQKPAAQRPRWVLGTAKGPPLHCSPPSTPSPSSLSTSLLCAIIKLLEKNSNQHRRGRKVREGSRQQASGTRVPPIPSVRLKILGILGASTSTATRRYLLKPS